MYVVREKGSPRRCGGQGDVLAGNLGMRMCMCMCHNLALLDIKCFMMGCTFFCFVFFISFYVADDYNDVINNNNNNNDRGDNEDYI